MRKETSIQNIKDTTKALIYTVPIKCDNDFGIVQHPFTNSMIGCLGKEFIDLSVEENKERWLKEKCSLIDKTDIDRIFYVLLGSAWLLTWLKYTKEDLTKEKFTEYLAHAWITEDNPNMDANVSIPELIKWFKECDKKLLMDEEDYEYWKSLPETVTLYRGVSKGRARYGLSWTNSRAKAEWFQNRFAVGDERGQLLQVTVSKEHCLCYFNTRNEREIVLDVNAVIEDIVEIEG